MHCSPAALSGIYPGKVKAGLNKMIMLPGNAARGIQSAGTAWPAP